MDQTVLAALKKWPDIPDVYGWMELDLRGRYRLRTSNGEPARFEPVSNAALTAFIGRNYQCDDAGRWFFQNGPQRVFVRLSLTPWVYRLHGTNAPLTHTGLEASHVLGLVFYDLATPVLLTDLGQGLVDDRDLTQLQALLTTANGSGHKHCARTAGQAPRIRSRTPLPRKPTPLPPRCCGRACQPATPRCAMISAPMDS